MSPAVSAPQPAPVLDFRRVFASPALGGKAPRGVALSPDGRWVTLLRPRADERERYDLWGFDRTAGQWRMLLDSKALSAGGELSEAEKMQRERARIGDLKGVVSYAWAQDGKSLLVPLDGKLWLVGLDGKASPVPGVSGEALNATLSPRGGYVSFVEGQRFHVVGLADGHGGAITPEEGEAVHWGEAEFVAQEEMDRMKGAWWSPDDARIAIERFDEAPVGTVIRAAIGASGTHTYPQRYPAAGTPNALVSLWVMAPDGAGKVRVDLGADPDIYLARVDWSRDGKVLYVQRENRAQTRLDMLAVDPATGHSRVLFSEEAGPKSWINLSNSYRFLADGSLVWWSERRGFGHLWHFKDGHWRQMTRGDWTVTALVGVDEKKGLVFFTGTKDDVLAPQVYAMPFDKGSGAGGPITRLTEPGMVNAATMDRSGQTLVVTRSGPAQPPQVYLADQQGQRLAWVEENAVSGDHPYAPWLAAHRSPEFGTIKAADGSDLHYMMIKPAMAPGKRYPVFFEHYGGPGAQTVAKGWLNPRVQAIVARGYIYFELDNRGSPHRGVAFERQIWHAMGSVEVADQKAGLAWLKRQPFVDPAKVATMGWSYGGYMTLKMLEADPGAYAAGIAVAPVTKWELYDTHYTERYLGDPRAVPEVYAASNAVADAPKIRDPLLVVHGLADDNVVIDNTTALVAKLQESGTPFEMMLYPGQTHAIAAPGVSQHVWDTIFAFLERRGITPPR